MNEKIRYVLIQCYGNTARSPLAEYLGNFYSKKYNLKVQFDSAGFINAFDHMQPQSQEYLRAKGIDFSDFTPKIINERLLKDNDLILTMETSHKNSILREFDRFDGLNEKVFTLKEFNGDKENPDIIDPYYTSSSEYKKICKLIDNEMEKVVNIIDKINFSAK